MQGDRDFDNTGVAVPFFGREAFFPRGPLRVAMASGAIVLPAFIVRLPDGRYRAIVEEPLPIETAGDRDAALRTNVQRYVAILERYVRAVPGAVVLLLSVLGRSVATAEAEAEDPSTRPIERSLWRGAAR